MRIGIIASTRDITSGGIIKVQPLDSNGQLADSTVDVVWLSMNVGAGQGIFSMPGVGTMVMFTRATEALGSLNNHLRNSDNPYEWVFVGALTSQNIQRRGESSVSDDKNNADEGNDTQKDHLQRDPLVKNIIVDSGVPEAGLVYADNHLPQQDVWKHKCGHKYVMSHKITDKGRHDNSILLQTAIGKKLHIDDGPAETKMDRITITDEHQNRIIIRTGGDNPDSSTIHTIRNQDYTTEKGSQVMTIMPGASEKSLMRRDQLGAGNMEDFVAQADYRLTVEKNILRISHNGDIEERADTGSIAYNSTLAAISLEAATSITLTCGASTITMTPAAIAIDSPTVTISGMKAAILSSSLDILSTTTLTGVTGTLNAHQHTGNLGAPTPII